MNHPEWCAHGHRCGLGEHRSAPIVIGVPGAGSFTLTRVRATTGRDHAEIRLNVTLPRAERDARSRLTALLTFLTTLLGPPRVPGTALRKATR